MTATVAPNNQSKARVGRRHRVKPARTRAVLIQCDQCCAKGTGLADNRRLYAVDLPSRRTARQFTHTCGGALVPYDIEAEA